jgi:hypothetical protein
MPLGNPVRGKEKSFLPFPEIGEAEKESRLAQFSS